MTPKKRPTSFMDVPQEETRGKGKDGIEKREAHGSISTLCLLVLCNLRSSTTKVLPAPATSTAAAAAAVSAGGQPSRAALAYV